MAKDLAQDWDAAAPLQADWDAAGISNSPQPLSTWERVKRGMYGGLQDLSAQMFGDAQDQAAAQQREKDYQARRAAFAPVDDQGKPKLGMDWARIGGEMFNPVNAAITAATFTPQGAAINVGSKVIGPLATRAIESGLGGSLMGMLSPVYGDEDRVAKGALGLAGGMLSAPLTGGVARAANPVVNPEIALLRQEGITPTMGQSIGGMARNIEDKSMSLPIVGNAITGARANSLQDLNRAVYNRALSPLGIKYNGPVGQEGVANVRKTLSDN